MISLSPLSTAHPRTFQCPTVRTSTYFYIRFILAMGRSPGFGSAAYDLVAHFGLAFATAPRLRRLTLPHTSNSPAHYAKGTPSAVSKPKPQPCLRPLVSGWFQVLFIPRQGCFSPFPHGTSSLSVVREYLALGGGPPGFPQDFSCPAVLGHRSRRVHMLSPTGLSPSLVSLSRLFD